MCFLPCWEEKPSSETASLGNEVSSPWIRQPGRREMLDISQLTAIARPERAMGRDSYLFCVPQADCGSVTCRDGRGTLPALAPCPYSAFGISSSAILREAGISHWNPSSLLQPAFSSGQWWPHQPRHGGGVPPDPLHAHPDPASAASLADPPPPPAAGWAGKQCPWHLSPLLGYLLGLVLPLDFPGPSVPPSLMLCGGHMQRQAHAHTCTYTQGR